MRPGAHDHGGLCRCSAAIYGWRKHFGQLEPPDVKRLKSLERENARLKKPLAERDLDIEVLKEIHAKTW